MCNACLHFFAFRTFQISDPFSACDDALMTFNLMIGIPK